ncbi:MAG TPA: Hpt domain-containing protein [Thermoanaerobaculia bacterium]|nr:Hpt domain-containing protein [Thermoanaerobaculia bacterium]
MTEVSQEDLHALQVDYLNDAREKLRLLREHAESLGIRKRFKTSFPILLYLSHQLKGSGGSLGFPAISEVAAKLSTALNEYLEEEAEPRPDPQHLSLTLMRLASDLEHILGEAEKSLRA